MKSSGINFKLLLLSVVIVTLLFIIGFQRLELDFDVVASLPQSDPVLKDASYIFKNHPMHDQILIDLKIAGNDKDVLVQAGNMVEKKLKESEFFSDVGIEKNGALIPELISHIADNLPYLFSKNELDKKISPMLQHSVIEKKIKDIHASLTDMQGIGQSQFISIDPLGIKNLVLARMAALSPVQGAVIYKNKLLSSDKKHLLVTAKPKISSTDTFFARSITQLISNIQNNLNVKFKGLEKITLTPMGAYRSALDNELIVRKDVKKAVIFATLGIALLLLLAFPRPWIGLLSLLPAIIGTMMAFFVYSLLYKSISIMVLGFGGAIISITVDHGIAYLLFLDRPEETLGKDVSREIRAVGLIAVLTTMGAFLSLCVSGFPVLSQLGQFTALGILFSFIFIHSVFPKIFPSMPPAPVKRSLPIQKLVNKLASFGNKGAIIALLFACFMVFFAKPVFHINLSSMNTVSLETKNAEKLFTTVWGDIFNRIHIMIEENSLSALQNKGDLLLEMINKDISSGVLSDGFLPAMLFPGIKMEQANFNAWKNFWLQEKKSDFKSSLIKIGEKTGFTADAFNPFLDSISTLSFKKKVEPISISLKYFNLMGISENKDNSTWVQFSSFRTGEKYNSEAFFKKYSSVAKIFDPAFFSQRLGNLLFSTFMKMLLIISISVILLLLLFFMDIELTIIAILPVIFALIATLGTLKLINHPLDIPALMLSIIVVGMGIDYSLFFVRSYQRYGIIDNGKSKVGNQQFSTLVKVAVFMASISTMIGFGILCVAEHALLKSAGITSLLGIGYSLIGTFLILPPLLDYRMQCKKRKVKQNQNITERVLNRYRFMEAYPRLFAKCKMMFDPMFKEFEEILKLPENTNIIIDLGSGYGVPACWLLERYPSAKIYGLDPDRERVRVANKAVGQRGVIKEGKAPFIPEVPVLANVAVSFDMMHYLDDDEIYLTLKGLYKKLDKDGILIIRITVLSDSKKSWTWRVENFKLKFHKIRGFYRPVNTIESFINSAGFEISEIVSSGSNDELVWFMAKKA